MAGEIINNLQENILTFEKLIPASIDEVWAAWTTEEGVKTFLAPACKIDLRPGGIYEMYFDIEAAAGLRGGEGCRILAIQKPILLSFTWNFPPVIPELRNEQQNTHVTLRFIEETANVTKVSLMQDGWGSGADWERGRIYFERAWGGIVLPRLYQRFSTGPISWNEF